MSAPDDVIPKPLDDDDDDVAWALQTAAVQWRRGAKPDAVLWLRRAVESAMEVGHVPRAMQLNSLIAGVEELLVNDVFSAPPPPVEEPNPVDALLHAPAQPGRASIDIEFDEENETTDIVSPANLLPPPTPPPPPPPAPVAAPPPAPSAKKRVRPPPPPSAMPKARTEPPPRQPMPAPAPVPEEVPVSVVPDSMPTVHATEAEILGVLPHPDEAQSVPAPPPFSELPPAGVEPDIEALLAAAAAPAEPAPLPAPSEPAPPPAPSEPAPPPAPSEPAPPPAAEAAPAEGEPRIGKVSLADVPGLQDLPPEAQAELVRSARIETLDVDEEVSSFAIALVVEGWASIMPSIADVACVFAQVGDVVFTHGTLEESVALRVVAGETDTRVAVWDRAALEHATSDCPWVADELRLVADRFQALAGATMGPLGERLDDTLRQMVTSRCEVRTLMSGEEIVESGKPVPGMFIVGAGTVELTSGEDVVGELGPGEFLFATSVMAASKAPMGARAGVGGALLLFAERHAAHELMLSVPPLLEILAG